MKLKLQVLADLPFLQDKLKASRYIPNSQNFAFFVLNVIVYTTTPASPWTFVNRSRDLCRLARTVSIFFHVI